MKTIAALQADARAKYVEQLMPVGIYSHSSLDQPVADRAYEILKKTHFDFLDEIILSTVRAVREATKLEETHAGDAVPSWKDYNRGWNNASAAQDRRFDSLLGGDAKSV